MIDRTRPLWAQDACQAQEEAQYTHYAQWDKNDGLSAEILPLDWGWEEAEADADAEPTQDLSDDELERLLKAEAPPRFLGNLLEADDDPLAPF